VDQKLTKSKKKFLHKQVTFPFQQMSRH